MDNAGRMDLFTMFFNAVGKRALSVVNNLGAAAIFFTRAFVMIFRPKQVPAIVQQVFYIGGGFIKSIVFAVLVSTVCCYQGYFTHMRSDGWGARSVSLSTTSAVVLSCVMILVSDYAVTSFLM